MATRKKASAEKVKNKNKLPIIRCPSMHHLVGSVKDAQEGKPNRETIVFGPKKRRLEDLLGVDISEKGEVTRIFMKEPFYWETWDFTEDIEKSMPSKPLIKDKKGKIIDNFKRNTTEEEKAFYLDSPFVSYPYAISFKKQGEESGGVEIGKILNPHTSNRIRIYFAKEVNFFLVAFIGEADLRFTTFRKDVYFGFAFFREKVSFESAVFVGESVFWAATFTHIVDFSNTKFMDIVYFDSIQNNKVKKKSKEKLLINFSGSVFKEKLSFSFNSETMYRDVTLGLYGSSIQFFNCNDKEFENITLLKATRLDNKKEEKSLIEEHLNELRVMRSILQGLNWIEAADRYYAKIMDQQLELKSFLAKTKRREGELLFERIIYKHLFGWGVRLKNIWLTVIGTLSAFFLFYYVSWLIGLPSEERVKEMIAILGDSFAYSFKTFLTIDISTFPEMPEWFIVIGIVETALGIILYTILVASIVRKFMKM